MLVHTPEIVWHQDIKPVLSVDHSGGRIATAGNIALQQNITYSIMMRCCMQACWIA